MTSSEKAIKKKKKFKSSPNGHGDTDCNKRFIQDPHLPLRAWRPPRLCLRTHARGRIRDC